MRLTYMNVIPFIISVFLSRIVIAQSEDSLTLTSFDHRQQQLNRNGMIVLGSWATASISTGLIARSQTTGTAHYFHEMNALWNTVNLTLAGVSLLQSRKEQPIGWNYSIKRQKKLETIFLVNSGLDLFYIGTGFYLRHSATSKTDFNAQRMEGYGNSLLLQGGFLLCFDSAMYFIHKRHGKQLKASKSQIDVSYSINGFTLHYQF